MSGPAFVHYGQLYLQSAGRDPELPESFAGHQNGLCGAAVEGTLFLVTGLHTGEVGFTIELHDDGPPIDDGWEEIVEASLRPGGEAVLTGFDSGYWPLELEQVDYRVRYCGWGMDAGHQAGPQQDGEPPIDRYLLQLWPAPPEPDRVVKQTSAQAAYWHAVARKTPPPLTPEQRAVAQRERERRADELRAWGGALPSERIRDVFQSILFVELDRPLLDELDRATPATLDAIARWSARRACAAAGLDQVDWIADALDRMDRGVDQADVFQPPPGALGPEGQPVAIATFGGWDESLSDAAKVLVVVSSVYDDPLWAAVDTLWMAIGAAGNGNGRQVIAELRQAVPELTTEGAG